MCRRHFHEATRRVLGAPSEWYSSTCIGLRCVEDWRIRDSRSGTWNWVGGEECVVLLIGGGGGDVWIAVVKMGEDYGVSHILVWEVLNVWLITLSNRGDTKTSIWGESGKCVPYLSLITGMSMHKSNGITYCSPAASYPYLTTNWNRLEKWSWFHSFIQTAAMKIGEYVVEISENPDYLRPQPPSSEHGGSDGTNLRPQAPSSVPKESDGTSKKPKSFWERYLIPVRLFVGALSFLDVASSVHCHL